MKFLITKQPINEEYIYFRQGMIIVSCFIKMSKTISFIT